MKIARIYEGQLEDLKEGMKVLTIIEDEKICAHGFCIDTEREDIILISLEKRPEKGKNENLHN